MGLVAAVFTASAGCTEAAEDADGWNYGGGGKEDGPTVTWSADVPHIVPEEMHAYLESYQWGDYHIVFHMSRLWFLMGDQGREWLDSLAERDADLQEGDPQSGVEFLTMHRAMIDHLRDRLGDLEVTNNEDGRTTVSAMLDGWQTDDEVAAHIEAEGYPSDHFRAAAARLADAASFATEDAFGLFLQTTLRLSRQVDANDLERRLYQRDPDDNAGIHNELHGVFTDEESPINVGNPQTNLSNQRFWAIHGWIEAKWRAFEQSHVRSLAEQDVFDRDTERFNLHMQLHSDFHDEHAEALPSPSRAVVEYAVERIFAYDIACADLEETVEMPDCVP